jgi:hypothetical protein
MSIYAGTNWRYEEAMSALHGFLVKNGFRKKGKADKNVSYSHTTYNGYNIAVPNDPAILTQFYLAISQDLYPQLYEGRRTLAPRLDCLNQMAGVVGGEHVPARSHRVRRFAPCACPISPFTP